MAYPKYVCGQRVWLFYFMDLSLTVLARKLEHKFLGLYHITKVYGPMEVCLLCVSLHVFRVKPVISSSLNLFLLLPSLTLILLC